MKINLTAAPPSKLETECLVVVVLDAADKAVADKAGAGKEKPAPSVVCDDAAVVAAAKEIIASGEVTGKAFETTLLHNPAGLKAKRLLLIGGGKVKSFSATELRKLAGAAVRTVKTKNLRSLVFAHGGGNGVPSPFAVRAIVEGAFIGDFDPGYYKSGKNKEDDQKIETLTIAGPGDAKSLETQLEVGRIVGESMNFTRDLVNEPSNLMTPTILAERAKKMASDVGLKCEVLGADKIRSLKMGAFWGVAQGSDEPPAPP